MKKIAVAVLICFVFLTLCSCKKPENSKNGATPSPSHISTIFTEFDYDKQLIELTK